MSHDPLVRRMIFKFQSKNSIKAFRPNIFEQKLFVTSSFVWHHLPRHPVSRTRANLKVEICFKYVAKKRDSILFLCECSQCPLKTRAICWMASPVKGKVLNEQEEALIHPITISKSTLNKSTKYKTCSVYFITVLMTECLTIKTKEWQTTKAWFWWQLYQFRIHKDYKQV